MAQHQEKLMTSGAASEVVKLFFEIILMTFGVHEKRDMSLNGIDQLSSEKPSIIKSLQLLCIF